MQRFQKLFRWKILVPLMGLGLLIAAPLHACNVIVSWNPNTEPDLAGYKVYYGTEPGEYTTSIDVGNVTQREVSGLEMGGTYYFAVTAYDFNGNESAPSTEVVYYVVDTDPPTITSTTGDQVDRVIVVFSEIVEEASAELVSNYSINNGIVVQTAELQSDNKTVYLFTTQHANGNYTVTVNNVRDTAQVNNTIDTNSSANYSWSGNDETPPTITSVELYRNDFIVITYSEAVNQTTALNVSNYSISPSINILGSAIDGTFTKVYLTTATHIPGNTYTLTVNNVQDAASPANTIAGNSQRSYDCISEDTTSPSMIAATLQSTTQLELEFNEVLNQATAEDASNYTITPSVSILGVSLDGTGTVVTLTTAVHSGGNYTVTASGVGDDATPSNITQSAELNYTYTPPDYTAPALVSAELTSDDLLQVTFSEPMEETSAENINNYSIQPSVNIVNATLDVSQTVVLLQTATHAGGEYTVYVSNVNDRAATPNVIGANSSTNYTYDPPDVTAPQLVRAELHGANVVELVFTEALDRTSSENITNYQISPSVTITHASLEGDSLNHVFLQTENHQQGQSYTITVQNVIDRADVPNTIAQESQASYDYPAVDTTPPALVSAEMQGDRFVKLTFSESLDETSAQNKANYTIYPSLNIEEATLDASLRSVLLKTTIHQPGNYTIIVQNVTDRANPANAIGNENEADYEVASSDVTAPSIIRAEIHGREFVEVVFSEPLDPTTGQDKSNYVIDNGISVLSVSLSQSQREAFLVTTSHNQGTYSVTVNGVKDQSSISNTIQANSKVSYTYTPADNIPPTLTGVTLLNPTMVELVFSEPLDRQSAETIGHYEINNGITISRSILDFSGTKVILQTSAHIPGSYIITINDIQDGSAAKNSIAANTSAQYNYTTIDQTAPYIVSATLKSDKMLVVTFSESLDPVSAQTKANYVVNNNIEVKSAFMASEEGQIVLETSSHSAGNFILTINGVKDASSSKNLIAPYSQVEYTYNPPDTLGPQLVSATLHTSSYLELVFDEALDAAEAQKAANYHIEPAIQVQNAVLDASLNKVWLFTASHSPGSYTMTVFGLKDRAFTPNTIGSNNTIQYNYTPPDTDPPALVSVQLRTPMSLALHFDEPIDRAAAEDLSNYTITPDIQVEQAYLLASLQTVHLETNPHQSSVNYTVEIRNIQDRAPTPNQITTPISSEYNYSPPDTTRPELVSVKLQGQELLELVFSEELSQASAENRENYKINPSVEVLNAYLDPNTLTRVYLETTTHMPGIGYDIYAENIKDRAAIPNTITAKWWLSYSLSVSGGSADFTPPQVAMIDVLSPTKMDIIFSEPVAKAVAENKENYVIADSINIQSAVLDSTGVRLHLTTTEHRAGKAYQVQVLYMEDQAPQPNTLSVGTPIKYMMSKGVTMSAINRPAYDMSLYCSTNNSYVDRDYTLTQVPQCFDGAMQILTANNDKTSTGDVFLSFELKGEATVYLAYDKQISQIPQWLSSWKATGEQIINSRSTVYNIYSKEVGNGRITLGGNEGTLDDNMYMVFMTPHFGSGSILASLSKASYQTKRVSIGDQIYIDRDYTVASLPDSLKSLIWIQTANDDKIDASEDFLSFTLNWGSRIYIAYDENIPTLPKWLSEDEGWQMIDEQMVDSRGNCYDLFHKEYESGEVTLGGNCGTLDDNMYAVLIQPIETDGMGVESQVPGYFNLVQNYPNPFNPRTTIPFKVLKTGRITMTVYNILGQKVKVLVDAQFEAGTTTQVEWDGTDDFGRPVASGMYLYRIQQDAFATSRRMILMR